MLTRREALAAPLASAVALRSPFLFAADAPKPADARLGKPKDYNGYFPFVVPHSKAEWEARRARVREQLLVANGLWPVPEKTPLNAVIHGRAEKDGYSIEKVYFVSTPGHYVTGNLYRPAGTITGPRPGVLFAHGHWKDGRFHEATEKVAAESLKNGGEPDADRSRFFMQAIPVTLARLGFTVFQYDMTGYADSTAVVHREGWKDAQAELWLQSQMGLQTLNSLRALDFITGLPDVDPKRIGMTGASGGGTQTFITAGIDDRLAAAFPAVMVSTAMQGGCVCENCSYLRVGTGNIEIAGLFAPKPLAMSAANDWTKDLMTKGYPELQALYKLYGAANNVSAKAWLEFGHQYNRHAREFMYAWFSKHLLGKNESPAEKPFKPTPVAELSVFDSQHPRPKDELNTPALRERMRQASDAQIAKLAPTDAASLTEFRRVIGTALRVMVNPVAPELLAHTSFAGVFPVKWPGGLEGDQGVVSRVGKAGHAHPYDVSLLKERVSSNITHVPTEATHWAGDAVPYAWVWPKGKTERWVVWVHPAGRWSLFENGDPKSGKWHPAAKALLDANYGMFAPDVLRTGDNGGGTTPAVDKNYAGFTFGYNRPLLADRVQDVLTSVAYVRRVMLKNGIDTAAKGNGPPVRLVGWGAMGPAAVLAAALAGGAVAKTAADLNGFRFENVTSTADEMMLPGAAKYGGLPAFLALCAPSPVLAHNHAGTSSGKLAKAAYDAAGASDKLTRSDKPLDPLKVAEWLTA